MTIPAGSSKGTIHLWSANITKEEIDKKGGLKQSLQKELEALYSNKTANTYPEQNISPYIDSTPYDKTPYLWTIYKTPMAGRYQVTMQGRNLNEKAAWKFWGTGYDFIHKLQKEYPNITELTIPGSKILLPDSVAKILFDEGNKIGIKVFENRELGKMEKIDKEYKLDISKFPAKDGEYGAEELKEDARDPSTRSKLTDPGHQQFQVYLGFQLNKIHVIKTPKDENPNNDPNKNWSVVPNKPSSANEPEGIEYFKTRDEAVNWINNQNEIQEDEQDAMISSVITANDLGEWFDPEEAAKVAWKMRTPYKEF